MGLRSAFVAKLLLLAIACLVSSHAAVAEPAAAPVPVSLGTQPLSLPDAVFGEVMKRDRVLARELEAAGLVLRESPYRKGSEMVPLLDGSHLDAGLMGDMPALAAAVQYPVRLVGLLKQTFSAIVARAYLPLARLKGQRIGYAFGSTAHYTLLQGLSSVGLDEKAVELVPLELNEMPRALVEGRIDAFAAWEPAPTIAMRQNRSFAVIYRGVNTSYLVMTEPFMRERPAAARALGAAFVRAARWLRADHANLMRAAGWALGAAREFSGQTLELSPEEVAEITTREVLDVLGAPFIPNHSSDENGQLHRELLFLRRLGKVSEVPWAQIRAKVDSRFLREVAAEVGTALGEFDYAP